MQMIKPRAIFVPNGLGGMVWIVRCAIHVGIGTTLDSAVARHREKFINRVTGPKAVHRLHQNQK